MVGILRRSAHWLYNLGKIWYIHSGVPSQTWCISQFLRICFKTFNSSYNCFIYHLYTNFIYQALCANTKYIQLLWRHYILFFLSNRQQLGYRPGLTYQNKIKFKYKLNIYLYFMLEFGGTWKRLKQTT